MMIARNRIIVVKWPKDARQRNARLMAVLRKIHNNPCHWEQTSWHCGTSHCFAGIAELSAARAPLATAVRDYFGHDSSRLPGRWFAGSSDGYTLIDASDRARYYLGLTHRQADALFSASNALDSLDRYVGDILQSPFVEEV